MNHSHRHHHPKGHSHPPATLSLSMLRLAAWQRLLGAALLAILLWIAIFWVMS